MTLIIMSGGHTGDYPPRSGRAHVVDRIGELTSSMETSGELHVQSAAVGKSGCPGFNSRSDPCHTLGHSTAGATGSKSITSLACCALLVRQVSAIVRLDRPRLRERSHSGR
jgi:hypothetical protein